VQGKQLISWLWDWLGAGSMGENYQVPPVVQPVAIVDGIEMPPNFQIWSNTGGTPLVAGTVNVPLGVPQAGKNRLWLGLWANRTAVAAGDGTSLIRGVVGAQALLWAEFAGVEIAAQFFPIIGGRANFVAAGPAEHFSQQGIPPVLATQASPVSLNVSAAAAVGTFNVTGYFVDLPQSAPIITFLSHLR
jgi:hypothetical protein